jgi:hypothetical protein
MNALAVVYVNAHLQDLLEDAYRRQPQVDRPSVIDRLRSAASKGKAALGIPLDNRGWMFPALDDASNRS